MNEKTGTPKKSAEFLFLFNCLKSYSTCNKWEFKIRTSDHIFTFCLNKSKLI